MGIKVPPGFIITTDTCQDYFKGSEAMSAHLFDALKSSITKLENKTGKCFSLNESSPTNTEPLLLSVRSGAAVDMPRSIFSPTSPHLEIPHRSFPSMMDSVLNVGVNDLVVQRLTSMTSNPKFALDVQRRFLQMFGSVVLNVPKEKYLKILADMKAREGVSKDYELSAQALQSVVNDFKLLGEVPSDPFEQLKMTVFAIFDSWLNPRAKKYRKLSHLSENLGTAIVVQVLVEIAFICSDSSQGMVFGNLNSESCVGKLFTRNPDTGVNEIYGEYSCCIQGDEVSGGFDENARKIDEFRTSKPSLYSELKRISGVLENFFGDTQEIEFTVENGELYFLESIPARRSPQASVKIAVDLALTGHLTERQSILRIDAQQMDYFLNPTMSQETDVSKSVIGTGLASTIGSAAGKAVFRSADAIAFRDQGVPTILICDDGSTEDATVVKMAAGMLLMHGGVTNSIVDLARSYDKTVITGAAKSGLAIDYNRECVYDDSGKVCIEKGQLITLDGPTGSIVDGNVVSVPTGHSLSPHLPQFSHSITHLSLSVGIQSDFRTMLRWTDQYRRTPLMVHAKTWNEVYRSLELRPSGVGLMEMESFFCDPDRLRTFQGYLFSESEQTRKEFLTKLEGWLTEDLRRVSSIFSLSVFFSLHLLMSSCPHVLTFDARCLAS
jgi:pyruvate, orthophosphate dikinase